MSDIAKSAVIITGTLTFGALAWKGLIPSNLVQMAASGLLMWLVPSPLSKGVTPPQAGGQ